MPGGQHAHAAFLDIVRTVNPELSQYLHDLNGRKPFTVSPIMGLPKPNHHIENELKQKNEITLREGWECWLRVTLLDEALFCSFIEYFLNPASPKKRGAGNAGNIRLGDAHFLVSEILTTPGSHPWAGFTTLDELQRRLDQPPSSSITLEFHSPVSFKLQDERVELLPYPKHVFGNLATAWRALSGENLVEAVEKHAETHWQFVLHRLERKSLTLHNRPQLGSVGRVEYQCLGSADTPLSRAMNLLADLAFYTGVGRKTAQGMGMVRRIYTRKGEQV